MGNRLGIPETSSIHRRFTELCIGTLSIFNAVTILAGVWLIYQRPNQKNVNDSTEILNDST